MAADRLIGTMAGNYKLVERLGAGGMGEVYKGVHATIGSKVAIKLLHAIAAREVDGEARFLREAQAVNRIEHDGIVKVIDAGRVDKGRPFLVMELLDGESLYANTKRGRMAVGDACAVMISVLDALAAAHAAGVVHRDLKPPNIFRTRSGRIVVLDFGVAKLMAPDANLRLTVSGMAVGTPHYMAPEQIRGKAITPAVDIYAAGIVLYELVCGRRPFEGDGDDSIFEGHLQRRPPPPRAIEPGVPVAVQDVILTALAKEPAKRFATAAAMRDALRTASATVAPQPAAPAAAQRSPWARPEGVTALAKPQRGTPEGQREVVQPPMQMPDTDRGGTPDAVVAHRERTRGRWLALAAVVTAGIITGAIFIANRSGETAPTTAVVHDAGAADATRVAQTDPWSVDAATRADEPVVGPKPIEPERVVPVVPQPTPKHTTAPVPKPTPKKRYDPDAISNPFANDEPRQKQPNDTSLVRPDDPRPIGTLEIRTEPAADIFIDGRRVGTGRWRDSIRLGEHRVEARATGYLTTKTTVTVVADKTSSLVLHLSEQPNSTDPDLPDIR